MARIRNLIQSIERLQRLGDAFVLLQQKTPRLRKSPAKIKYQGVFSLMDF